MNSQDDLKNLYGKEYVQSFEFQPHFRLARLLRYIELNKAFVVADFACGNGIMMELVASEVKSYVGIDFSEAFIKAANEKKKKLSVTNARFECADIIEFCKQHIQVFDIAFAMDFSEHVYDSNWESILCSIKASLKQGGKIYLHTPNAEFFLEKLKDKNLIFKQFPEHVAVRSPEQNVQILGRAGFKDIKVRLVSHYNYFLRVFHLLSFFPVIGKYFKARILIEATA